MKEKTFFEKVYDVVSLIPEGRVTSYGAIAEAIGAKKAARMVGYAMNNAHNISPYIPAHRVLNRKGLLTGKNHFATPNQMEELLLKEGIEVRDNQVLNFKEIFWNPMEELGEF